jgi:hypothetical protein
VLDALEHRDHLRAVAHRHARCLSVSRRRTTRWYVSSLGWWWSRGRWQTEVSEPPFASHSEHRTRKAAQKASRNLLRAGADEAEMFCVYKSGKSRAFACSAVPV